MTGDGEDNGEVFDELGYYLLAASLITLICIVLSGKSKI